MEQAFYLWCLCACAILFLLMGFDKRRARQGGRRIAEATLFAWALLGGAVGGTLGMFTFRHKTRHRSFRFGFPLLAMLQIALLIWLRLRHAA